MTIAAKISLGIAALVLAGTGAYVWINPKAPAYNSPDEAPGQGVVGAVATDRDPFDVAITYTDDGYDPAEVTVQKGTRVRFVNEAETGTWPASGVHPTHSLYPEKNNTDCLGSSFDSCAELKNGEFFAYTFNYVGEWRFHDHLHAYHTGVV